ncbi:MAG: ferritin family protein [Eubacteriaceae bacterium]|nr:ferritin family protein [Eubacteriaceae bacterium]
MDILSFAVKMEREGEKYYKEQADINQNNSLHTIFMNLAQDECHHARIIENKLEGIAYQPKAEVSSRTKNVFKNTDNFKMEIKEIPQQIDAYRMAMEKEKESIELYKKLLNETSDDKALFEFLIAQEEEHYKVLDEIVQFVNRPNEWVGNAEFGKREEY